MWEQSVDSGEIETNKNSANAPRNGRVNSGWVSFNVTKIETASNGIFYWNANFYAILNMTQRLRSQ